MDTKYIYLVPDIKECKKKAREYVHNYNKKVKDEHPDTFKKYTLKANHWSTIEQLILMYYKHTERLKKSQIKDINTSFKINNVGLSKTREYHKITSYRHIIRLKEAGIITDKITHGSNSSFEIVLNTDILEFLPSSEWHQLLIDELMAFRGGKELTTDELKKIYSVKFPIRLATGGVVAVCNDIVIRTLQELNINMNAEYCSHNFVVNKKTDFVGENITRTQKQVSLEKNEIKDSSADDREIKNAAAENQTCGGTPLPEAAKKLSKEAIDSLIFTVSLAWNFAFSVLWNSRIFAETEIQQAKYCLLEYFSSYYSYKDWQKMSTQAFNEFCQRILLADKYRRKSPERFIPNPSVYFNLRFSHGFIGTKTWYEKTCEQREKNKEYYLNLKLLSHLYKTYSANPTFHNYMSAVQTLGKKKDKNLLELLNLCVTNSQYYCPEIFKQHYLEAKVA